MNPLADITSVLTEKSMNTSEKISLGTRSSGDSSGKQAAGLWNDNLTKKVKLSKRDGTQPTSYRRCPHEDVDVSG